MTTLRRGRASSNSRGTLTIPDEKRELQYRPTLDGWSPDAVKIAGDSADSGNLMRLADFCETVMADDRVDGVLDTRTHGLLGLPLSFVGGSEQMRTDLQGQEGAPGEWYKQHPESELVALQKWGLMLGVGLAQRVPLPYVYKKTWRLKTWSPRWLTYVFTGESRGWHVQTQDGYKPVLPGAGEWIVYTPYGGNRPWANGKWRKLAFPWLLKRFALEDRANLGEAIGAPTWVGKSPQGATERQRQQYLAQLVALGKKGKIVLPEGWDLVLKEATGRTWEIYSEAVAWSDQAITIVLAGQVVTTEGSPGFSSGNVQERIEGNLIRFDGESLSTTLHEQSLVPLAWDWYQDGDAAPYAHWDTKKPVDKQAEATTLEITGRAVKDLNSALAGQGKRVNLIAVCDMLQVPLEDLPKASAPTDKIPFAPTDIARGVTLNELRLNFGMGPLLKPDNKTEDPRGYELLGDLAKSDPIPGDAPIPGDEPPAVPPKESTP